MKPDEVVAAVVADLAEHFGDLDDSDEAPFGEYARVEVDPRGTLDVVHETEPWGIRIRVEPLRVRS